MPAYRMVIADKDEDYCKSLVDFLVGCLPGWEIVSFTAENLFCEYLRDTPALPDMVLASESFQVPEELLPKQCTLVQLVEGENDPQAISQKISKYQYGDLLIKQVLELYGKSNPPAAYLHPGVGKKTRIVGVFSAAGGSGKTVIAMGLSMQLSWEGRKVFYLNTENIASTELFLEGQAVNSISGVFYYLKNDTLHLHSRIEEAKCLEPVLGISHFRRPDSMLDLKEDLTAEITRLIGGLAAGGLYDYLVIDMSAHLDGNNLMLLKECDSILIVCLDDPLCELKTRLLLEEFALLAKGKSLQLANKSQLVLNKEQADADTGLAGAFPEMAAYCGWNIKHRLPYVKNLLVRHGGKYRPDLNSSFGTALLRLSKDL